MSTLRHALAFHWSTMALVEQIFWIALLMWLVLVVLWWLCEEVQRLGVWRALSTMFDEPTPEPSEAVRRRRLDALVESNLVPFRPQGATTQPGRSQS